MRLGDREALKSEALTAIATDQPLDQILSSEGESALTTSNAVTVVFFPKKQEGCTQPPSPSQHNSHEPPTAIAPSISLAVIVTFLARPVPALPSFSVGFLKCCQQRNMHNKVERQRPSVYDNFHLTGSATTTELRFRRCVTFLH